MKVNLPRFKISLKPSRIKYIFIYPRLLTVQTKCAPESNFTPAVTGGSSAHLTISGCHVLAWSYDAVSPPAPLPGHSAGFLGPRHRQRARDRDQKFGKRRGVADGAKLPRESHRPELPTPGHLSQAALGSSQLTSDPRSGRGTAES